MKRTAAFFAFLIAGAVCLIGLGREASADVLDIEAQRFLARQTKWEADRALDFSQRNARFLDLLEASENPKLQPLAVEFAVYSLLDVSYVVRMQSIKFLADQNIFSKEIAPRVQESAQYDPRAALYRFKLRRFSQVSLNRFADAAKLYLGEADFSVDSLRSETSPLKDSRARNPIEFQFKPSTLHALNLPKLAANDNAGPSFLRDWLVPKLKAAAQRFQRAPTCGSAFRGSRAHSID